ncbi:MAG: fused MFS/spermidine synthase [Verrucomicrobia bacterium]|nr:fused MFS/spermidine synthase [Verrucomicrobiota bacterium]
MLPFALTIFTGAFLLFQVQPLIGKYILPWFGGSPGVWTTCLLFFQTLLLGGYAYAHFTSTRLKPRAQAMVHLGLLAIALLCLPIIPAESWKPTDGDAPVWRILRLLTLCVGLPYFVLSSTGPLMQRWFSRTNPGVSPYRLYALSNVGSLLALLSYPVWFEVQFSRREQAVWWSVGLALFAVLCAYCAWRVWKTGDAPEVSTPEGSGATSAEDEPTPVIDKVLWLVLPAVASLLLLATTNKLCQEIAVIPFLWIIPLALYLLTFVICFDHARWYRREVFIPLLVGGIAAIWQLQDAGRDAPMKLQIVGYNVVMFIACMVCHGELYRLRPPASRLTGYYLLISAGGALGGLFVAVVAPMIFVDYRELEIGLGFIAAAVAALCFRHRSRELVMAVAAGTMAVTLMVPWMRGTIDSSTGFVAEWVSYHKRFLWLIAGGLMLFVAAAADFRTRRLVGDWSWRMGTLVGALAVALCGGLVWQARTEDTHTVIRASRNFYGTLKVFDYSRDDEGDRYLSLMHGATTHGIQFSSPDKALLITSYYGDTSGVGLAFKHIMPEGPRHIGVVGLGTGTLAAYGRKGDRVRYYEINPAVEQLARDPFTYLSRTPAKVDVVFGDARLTMERELAEKQPQQFDFLALDAFSSDSVPAHLLTREAFEIFLKHMKPDGVIAVHISNRYLELQPVVDAIAQHFKLGIATISDDFEEYWYYYTSTWVLLSRNHTVLGKDAIIAAKEEPRAHPRPPIAWTDDYVSLFKVLK